MANKKSEKKSVLKQSDNATVLFFDREITGSDGAANWNSLHSALLAGRSVELIPIVLPHRVTMIARIWFDYRADGSNDPTKTPPNPPLR